MSVKTVDPSINYYTSFLRKQLGASGYETGMTSGQKVSPHLICVGHLAHLLDRKKNGKRTTFQISSVRDVAPV